MAGSTMIPTAAHSLLAQWILCVLLVAMFVGWFTIRRVSSRERRRVREEKKNH